MNNIILDLGYDVSFILKWMWEMMGNSSFIWSPIELSLVN
jgi:hypothetical protein